MSDASDASDAADVAARRVDHCYLLDPRVMDLAPGATSPALGVAVFVSGSALTTSFAPCRLFAQKLLSTVQAGPRRSR